MSTSIGIIGGTGFQTMSGADILSEDSGKNKFGVPSAPLVKLDINGTEIIFIARHGSPHKIPPHMVNYRANIYAMKEAGVDRIISVNAVGGITTDMAPGTLVLPDQIIDYTWDRKHTFYDDNPESVVHIDFTHPYGDALRNTIIAAASAMEFSIVDHGTYGATQGPRLETAAEIKRLEIDGCDIVGMTGMPEAALSRELDIDYVAICLVVNWAAGKTDDVITMEIINAQIETGMGKITALIKAAVKNMA